MLKRTRNLSHLSTLIQCFHQSDGSVNSLILCKKGYLTFMIIKRSVIKPIKSNAKHTSSSAKLLLLNIYIIYVWDHNKLSFPMILNTF